MRLRLTPNYFQNDFRYNLALVIFISFVVFPQVISKSVLNKSFVNNSEEIIFDKTSRIKRDVWGTLCLRDPKKHNSENEPKFVLFTKPHLNLSQSLFDDNLKLNNNFKSNLPTKIIIHGWTSNIHLTPLVDIKNQYLLREHCNVIFVDWENLAADDCYLYAILHCRYVGQRVALMVQRLKNAEVHDIHMIGFSLGAHVSGFAGFYLRPYKIPRITGLDPAMPGFTFASNNRKLDAGDAQFVDIYHTNAFIQGKIEQTGSVDFYMNGGITQPGCDKDSSCDHARSAMYFAESINSNIGFWGWPCPSFWKFTLGSCPPSKHSRILAGDKVDKKSKNYYIVKTNAQSPFAILDI